MHRDALVGGGGRGEHSAVVAPALSPRPPVLGAGRPWVAPWISVLPLLSLKTCAIVVPTAGVFMRIK